jgi:hypothetical protein
MSDWRPTSTRNWWDAIKPSSSAPPDTLPELESPHLLSLIPKPTSLQVVKAVKMASSPSPRALSEEDGKIFLSEHHAKASRGDITGMMSDYDQRVDFLDKGFIPFTQIQAEEAEYRKKWRNGTDEVVGLISAITNQASGRPPIRFHSPMRVQLATGTKARPIFRKI